MKVLIRIRHMRARAGKWEQHILLSILLMRYVSVLSMAMCDGIANGDEAEPVMKLSR